MAAAEVVEPPSLASAVVADRERLVAQREAIVSSREAALQEREGCNDAKTLEARSLQEKLRADAAEAERAVEEWRKQRVSDADLRRREAELEGRRRSLAEQEARLRQQQTDWRAEQQKAAAQLAQLAAAKQGRAADDSSGPSLIEEVTASERPPQDDAPLQLARFISILESELWHQAKSLAAAHRVGVEQEQKRRGVDAPASVGCAPHLAEQSEPEETGTAARAGRPGNEDTQQQASVDAEAAARAREEAAMRAKTAADAEAAARAREEAAVQAETAAKEAEAAAKEADAAAREAEVAARAAEAAAKEAEASAAARTDGADAGAAEEAAALEAPEARTRQVTRREDDVARREDDVARREDDVAIKTKAFVSREEAVVARENAVANTVGQLAREERAVTTKQGQLLAGQTELTEKLKDLAETEAALTERSNALDALERKAALGAARSTQSATADAATASEGSSAAGLISLHAARKATTEAVVRRESQLAKEHAGAMARAVASAVDKARTEAARLAHDTGLAHKAEQQKVVAELTRRLSLTECKPATDRQQQSATSSALNRLLPDDQSVVPEVERLTALLALQEKEAARIDARLTQIFIWAEQRESQLRTSATRQLGEAKSSLTGMRTELAARTEEARSWHGVAEELATEHRDAEVIRTMTHARGVRLMHGWAKWRATISVMGPVGGGG